MFFTHDRLDEIGAELARIPPGEDEEEMRRLAVEAQEILAEECPFIGTATAGWKAVFNKTRWDNWPVMGETTYVPNNTLPSDAILTLMNVEPRQ